MWLALKIELIIIHNRIKYNFCHAKALVENKKVIIMSIDFAV